MLIKIVECLLDGKFVAQATVRSKAPLGGYISYTIGNTCIFEEVMSHSNTIATRWRHRKTHARLHCRLSGMHCHLPLVTCSTTLSKSSSRASWATKWLTHGTSAVRDVTSGVISCTASVALG